MLCASRRRFDSKMVYGKTTSVVVDKRDKKWSFRPETKLTTALSFLAPRYLMEVVKVISITSKDYLLLSGTTYIGHISDELRKQIATDFAALILIPRHLWKSLIVSE